jgi:hypothetical protein
MKKMEILSRLKIDGKTVEWGKSLQRLSHWPSLKWQDPLSRRLMSPPKPRTIEMVPH